MPGLETGAWKIHLHPKHSCTLAFIQILPVQEECAATSSRSTEILMDETQKKWPAGSTGFKKGGKKEKKGPKLS